MFKDKVFISLIVVAVLAIAAVPLTGMSSYKQLSPAYIHKEDVGVSTYEVISFFIDGVSGESIVGGRDGLRCPPKILSYHLDVSRTDRAANKMIPFPWDVHIIEKKGFTDCVGTPVSQTHTFVEEVSPGTWRYTGELIPTVSKGSVVYQPCILTSQGYKLANKNYVISTGIYIDPNAKNCYTP